MKELLERLKSFARKHRLITKGSKIGVAVSGGPDSVFLLQLMNNIKEEFNLKLTILHFNHKIRQEADAEEEFVKGLADALNLPILTGSGDVVRFKQGKSLSLEQAARIKRYEFFEKAKAKLNLNCIATGHTLDDFVETLLMNLLRGSSIDGLVSLKPHRGYFIRPILPFSKNEIEAFLRQNKITFVFDKSNLDTKFTRNKIRHRLLPVLEDFNPNIKQTLFRFGMTLLEDVSLIDNLVELEFVKSVKVRQEKAVIEPDLSKNPAILKRVLSKAVKKILNIPYSLSYNNLERLKEAILEGKTVHLRGLIKAKKAKNTVIIEKYED